MAASNNRFSGRRIASLYADLTLCAVAIMLSAWAYLSLPEGSALRLLLTAPMILFVPGYLLVESFRSSRQPFKRRLWSVAVAPGASIALVGLLALATAFLPGGFRADSIVTIVTLCGIGLVAAASYHRARLLITAPRNVPPPRQPDPTHRRRADLPPRTSPIAIARRPPQTRPDSRAGGLPPAKATTEPSSPPSSAQPRVVQTGRL